MGIRSFLVIFATIFLASVSNLGFSADKTTASEIKRQVSAYLDKELEQHLALSGLTGSRHSFQVAALDPRLRLAACSQKLTVKPKTDQIRAGRLLTTVSCEGSSPWTIFVPVNIDIFRQIAVAAAPLSRGEQVSAGDVRLQELNIARLNGGYLLNLNEAIGMQVKRPLQPDQPILSSHLELPLAIKRGDAVTLVASSGGLRVKSNGTALSNGRVGEQISVKNKRSSRVVKAQVIGPGRAEVTL